MEGTDGDGMVLTLLLQTRPVVTLRPAHQASEGAARHRRKDMHRHAVPDGGVGRWMPG